MLNEVLTTVSTQLVGPAIAVILAAALAIGKSYLTRFEKSTIAKNDKEQLKATLDAKNAVLQQIESIVSNAVGANMQDANKLKENGTGKLTAEDQYKLKSNAKTLVMTTLPSELFDESSSLYNMFGGKGNIEAIVDAMIENYVYKLKMASAE